MEHLEWPEKFGFKLSIPFRLDMLAIQPDLLTQCVAPGLHSFVMSSFLEVLSVQKVLATNVHQLPQFHSQSFG